MGDICFHPKSEQMLSQKYAMEQMHSESSPATSEVNAECSINTCCQFYDQKLTVAIRRRRLPTFSVSDIKVEKSSESKDMATGKQMYQRSLSSPSTSLDHIAMGLRTTTSAAASMTLSQSSSPSPTAASDVSPNAASMPMLPPTSSIIPVSSLSTSLMMVSFKSSPIMSSLSAAKDFLCLLQKYYHHYGLLCMRFDEHKTDLTGLRPVEEDKTTATTISEVPKSTICKSSHGKW